jgi:hypothetical protein
LILRIRADLLITRLFVFSRIGKFVPPGKFEQWGGLDEWSELGNYMSRKGQNIVKWNAVANMLVAAAPGAHKAMRPPGFGSPASRPTKKC